MTGRAMARLAGIVLGAWMVAAHPECVGDSHSPFYGGAGLNFCRDFRIGVDQGRDGTCCTRRRNRELHDIYHQDLHRLPDGAVNACKEVHRRMLCAECHPFSAHLYASRDTSEPLLCNKMAKDWVDHCSQYLSHRANVTMPTEGAPESFYCFPFSPSKFWSAEENDGQMKVAFPLLEGRLPAGLVGMYVRPDTGAWWAISMSGLILEIDADPEAHDMRLVLDLSEEVRYTRSGSEGLLGLAFSPTWNDGRKEFYLFFSIYVEGDAKRGTRVSRFTYSDDGGILVYDNNQKSNSSSAIGGAETTAGTELEPVNRIQPATPEGLIPASDDGNGHLHFVARADGTSPVMATKEERLLSPPSRRQLRQPGRRISSGSSGGGVGVSGGGSSTNDDDTLVTTTTLLDTSSGSTEEISGIEDTTEFETSELGTSSDFESDSGSSGGIGGGGGGGAADADGRTEEQSAGAGEASATPAPSHRRRPHALPEVIKASQTMLLQWEQPYSSHKSGWLGFGPHDGLLYISSGDGGSENDPENNAQNHSALLGKVLRLDVVGHETYAVPAGNPHGDLTFAWGLRNPHRCSFDDRVDRTPTAGGPLVVGPVVRPAVAAADLWCGDVGQAAREEVDVVRLGGNYGWSYIEGTRCNEEVPSRDCDADTVPPVFEYCHPGVTGCPNDLIGNAVVGGFVYRGSKYPSLVGDYIFADYRTSNVIRLRVDRAADGSVRGVLGHDVLGAVGSSVSALAEDRDGELFVLTHSYKAPSSIYLFACGPVCAAVEPQQP